MHFTKTNTSLWCNETPCRTSQTLDTPQCIENTSPVRLILRRPSTLLKVFSQPFLFTQKLREKLPVGCQPEHPNLLKMLENLRGSSSEILYLLREAGPNPRACLGRLAQEICPEGHAGTQCAFCNSPPNAF